MWMPAPLPGHLWSVAGPTKGGAISPRNLLPLILALTRNTSPEPISWSFPASNGPVARARAKGRGRLSAFPALFDERVQFDCIGYESAYAFAELFRGHGVFIEQEAKILFFRRNGVNICLCCH